LTKPTYKEVKPDEKVPLEKVEVHRISIDPTLSILELLTIINEKEKEGIIILLDISFESSPQSAKYGSRIGFGKDGRLIVRRMEDTMYVPKRTFKFTKDYTIEDGIEAFEELDQYLIETKHDYTLDIYPIYLTVLDKGAKPERAPMIIRFGKKRKVDKNSEIGLELSGAQIMPLDAIKLFTAKRDKRTKNWRKGSIPSRIADKMKRYIDGTYFIEADDVKNYTRHIYKSDFTIKTTCIVGKERKTFDRYTPISGGECRKVPKD